MCAQSRCEQVRNTASLRDFFASTIFLKLFSAGLPHEPGAQHGRVGVGRVTVVLQSWVRREVLADGHLCGRPPTQSREVAEFVMCDA